MMKLFRQLLIAFMLIAPAFVVAQDGPESGGGGGVIYTVSGPRLVDFYNIKDGVTRLNEQYRAHSQSQLQSAMQLSFGREDRISDPAFQEVLRIYTKWSEVPFDTIGALINVAVYRPLLWDFVAEPVSAPASYRPSLMPPTSEIQPVAFYARRERSFHVRINLGIWNQLPLADQSGLLIHETLRHVQIGLSQGFDDEALQKAVAMMMICKPSVRLNQYLFFLLNNRRDLAEARFEPYETLTHECWK